MPGGRWQIGFSRFLYPIDNRRHGYLGVAIEHVAGSNYRATVTPYYFDPGDPDNAHRFYDDVTVLRGRLRSIRATLDTKEASSNMTSCRSSIPRSSPGTCSWCWGHGSGGERDPLCLRAPAKLFDAVGW
jgi:hypothetical protein